MSAPSAVHPVTTPPSRSTSPPARTYWSTFRSNCSTLWSTCFPSSATPSQGAPSQPQAPLVVKTFLGPYVIPDNEIEQIWHLRRKGKVCPPLSDKTNRPDLHSLAEEFWKEQAAEAAQRLDAYSSYLAASNNELYQLIGFFSVFQGVLLTASAQSNLLCCSNRWIPITLCALATVCTCWGVFLKLKEVREFRGEKDSFNAQHKHRNSQLLALRQERDTFDFRVPKGTYHSSKGFQLVKEVLIFVAIIVFSGIIAFGSYKILCDPGTPCK